jgi:putative endonuclease
MRLGKVGERCAAGFLRERGFGIIGRNWVCPRGEIDIIAIDKSCGALVFVEVRLRTEGSAITGYSSIVRGKKDTLRRACSEYLRKFTNPNVSYRFDIVEVEMCLSANAHRIFHYENVPLFSRISPHSIR